MKNLKYKISDVKDYISIVDVEEKLLQGEYSIKNLGPFTVLSKVL